MAVGTKEIWMHYVLLLKMTYLLRKQSWTVQESLFRTMISLPAMMREVLSMSCLSMFLASLPTWWKKVD
uniref:Uncharacterized protein n=2 Tax=Brassica oleracea TaxID=3712 RepID=A0A0D3CQP7_BRAOL